MSKKKLDAEMNIEEESMKVGLSRKDEGWIEHEG